MLKPEVHPWQHARRDHQQRTAPQSDNTVIPAKRRSCTFTRLLFLTTMCNKSQVTKNLTCSSSGEPCFSLRDDIKACKILLRCLVNASPATDDRKDNALVFTGGEVNYRKNANLSLLFCKLLEETNTKTSIKHTFTWGTKYGKTTLLFTAITCLSPSNANSDNSSSSCKNSLITQFATYAREK